MTGRDELDGLTRIAEMRTILARAGRQDLADLAWAQLCPAGVPLRVRHNALTMAGYPFGAEALRRQPEAARVLQAAASLYGEREWFPVAAENVLSAQTLVEMGLLERGPGSGADRKYRVTRPGRVAAFDLGMPA